VVIAMLDVEMRNAIITIARELKEANRLRKRYLICRFGKNWETYGKDWE
jgi:hypothetical protein